MLVISDAAIRKHLLKNISVDKALLRLRECNMKLLKLEWVTQFKHLSHVGTYLLL